MVIFIQNSSSSFITKDNSSEKESSNKSLYNKREAIEIKSVPESLGIQILEENVCKEFSITGVNVTQKQLCSCHHLTKWSCAVVKFKCCSQRHNVLLIGKNSKHKP